MKQQQGQALAEGLIILVGVLALFVAATWLGRLQDVALQEQNAARFGAFELARAGQMGSAKIQARFFSGSHAGWRTHQGAALVPQEAIRIQHNRQSQLNAFGQPGGNFGSAVVLRKEWKLQDMGIARVSIAVRPPSEAWQERAGQSNTATALAGKELGFTGKIALSLHRHLAILTGAGHTTNARSAHERASRSGTAWRHAANASYAAGKTIAAAAMPVDAAWYRAGPIFDWFMPWVGKTP